jgi:cytidylate kinase
MTCTKGLAHFTCGANRNSLEARSLGTPSILRIQSRGPKGSVVARGFSFSATKTPGRTANLLHWPVAVARWLRGQATRPKELALPATQVPRFRNVCISRESGAGGGTIARMVADRLGWKVYDREILEVIAHRMEVSHDVVLALDELSPGLVQDWLLPLREEHYAPQEAYLDHLAKLMLAIGSAGESVIVGRGANFMLPRGEVLAVRVIAPLKVRAQRLSEKMGVSVRTARRAARDLDQRRLRFARTMYRADAADPHHYDLVLDSASLGLSIAAEVIVRAVQAGMPPRVIAPPPSPPAPALEPPSIEPDSAMSG